MTISPITNPIIPALAALSDAELRNAQAAFSDLSAFESPDIVDWVSELGMLLAFEQLARQTNGTRPSHTNALATATNRLSRESVAALVVTLRALATDDQPDGAPRRFARALGMLLAVRVTLAGTFDPAREN